MSRIHIRNPVAQCLVDRIFKSATSGLDGHNFSAEQLHAGNVESLTFGVNLTHVNNAVESEESGSGSTGHAVLPSSSLGDDALLAHTLCKQRLPQNIVDLVRSGVVEILTL